MLCTHTCKRYIAKTHVKQWSGCKLRKKASNKLQQIHLESHFLIPLEKDTAQITTNTELSYKIGIIKNFLTCELLSSNICWKYKRRAI